jgi:polyphosphate glucokinase
VLVPNTEFGHIEVDGEDGEKRASAAVRDREELSYHQWAKRVDRYLDVLEAGVWPDLIIVGGGVSKKADKWVPLLSTRTPVVPAQLLNDAGIVGAALAAAERIGN